MIYGYLRVSTDKQDCENQKVGVVKLAETKGWKIDNWIVDDGVSGAKEPEERKLGKLLKKIKKDDVIICSELSRLGRKLFMVISILEHCMKIGAKVLTVKDGYELGDNVQSKVLAFAFGLVAELEREMISKRTKEAIQRLQANGGKFGRPKGAKNKKSPMENYDFEKLKSLIQKGYSLKECLKHMGLKQRTVYKYITKEEKDTIQELIKKARDDKRFEILQNIDLNDLEEYLKNKNSFSSYLKKLNIPVSYYYDCCPAEIKNKIEETKKRATKRFFVLQNIDLDDLEQHIKNNNSFVSYLAKLNISIPYYYEKCPEEIKNKIAKIIHKKEEDLVKTYDSAISKFDIVEFKKELDNGGTLEKYLTSIGVSYSAFYKYFPNELRECVSSMIKINRSLKGKKLTRDDWLEKLKRRDELFLKEVIDLSNFQIYPTVYDAFVDIIKGKHFNNHSLDMFLNKIKNGLDYCGRYFEFLDFYKQGDENSNRA